MTEIQDSTIVCLEIDDSETIEEVVLAFRVDGELCELASETPPVRAVLEQPRQPR